jgi:hypothetical protein
MDDVVRAAMARWPDVPETFGWLALDARGRWRVKGSGAITHPGVVEFIGRNYAHDARGRWFFQNGPQRVYVRLDCTPWVLRREPSGALCTHTGTVVDRVTHAWLTDDAMLLLGFDAPGIEPGVACVDDRDLPAWLDALRDAEGRPFDEATLARWCAVPTPETDGPLAEHAAASADQGSSDALTRTGTLLWEDEALPLARVTRARLGERFGFDPDPRPAPGQPDC